MSTSTYYYEYSSTHVLINKTQVGVPVAGYASRPYSPAPQNILNKLVSYKNFKHIIFLTKILQIFTNLIVTS